MDFDLNQFDAEIARYDAIHQKDGGTGIAFGAKDLSSTMAVAIAKLLPELNAQSPKIILDKIEYLCAKAVEYYPYTQARYVLQGQFYMQTEQFDKAVTAFKGGYEANKDIIGYPVWPHLQKMESNLTLVAWLADALRKAGHMDEAMAFNKIRVHWEQPSASGREPQ